MDQFLKNLPSFESCANENVKSNDEKQFSSNMIKSDFSTSHANLRTSNLLACYQRIPQPTDTDSVQSLMPGAMSVSEMNPDGKAKTNDVRKKGRPPKPENQSADIFKCNLCSKVFSSSSSLAKHRVTHNEERKFVCPECSKTFKRNDHLTGHMLTHSDIKPFSCDRCDKSYCDSRSLKRHVDQFHLTDSIAEARSPSRHPEGDGSLPSKDRDLEELMEIGSSSLTSSGFTSSPTQVQLCRMCGRTFKTLQALNGHMRFHTSNVVKKEESSLQNAKQASSFSSAVSSLNIEASNPSGLLVGVSQGALQTGILSDKIFPTPTRIPSQVVEGSSQSAYISSFLLGHNDRVISSTLTSDRSDNIVGKDGSILLMNNPSCSLGSFLFQPRPNEQQSSSYSLQLQHLAQQVQPGLVVQIPKVFDVLQGNVQAVLGGSGLPTNQGPFAIVEGDQHRPPSHSLLHSLLLQKNDRMPEQPSRVPDPSLSCCPLRLPEAEASNRGSVFAPNPELLGSYSEEANFDRLDPDGIEKLLDHSGSRDDPCQREEQVKEEDTAMENSIPEDLRSIPTHALQMFSISSSTSSRPGTPPPITDFVGDDTEVFDEGAKAAEVEAYVEEIAHDSPGAPWDEAQALSGEIIERILDIPRSNCDFGGSDQVPSKGEALDSGGPAPGGKVNEGHVTTCQIKPPTSPQRSQKQEKFRNPGLLKMKRRNWPGPLIIPASSSSVGPSQQPFIGGHRESSSSGSSNFAFQSRLRSPRIIPGSGSFDSSVPPPFNLPFVPYTPPPMLSPVRSGSGLFCLIQAALATQTPPANKTKKIGGSTSPDLFEGLVEEVVTEESTPDEPPATDIQPHINEGPEYQAEIPDLETDRSKAFDADDHAGIVWDPSVINGISEGEVKTFMDFSSCAAVPFNGCNKELAHHILHLYGGDVKKACLAIMESQPLLPPNDYVDTYKYSETSVWSSLEIEKFNQSIFKNSKDFFLVSKEVATKSCKECIEFYYLWKKVCAQEGARLKSMRRKNDTMYNNLRSRAAQQLVDMSGAEQLLELCAASEQSAAFRDGHQLAQTNNIESFPFPLISSPEGSRHQPPPAAGNPKKYVRPPKTGGRSTKHRPKPPRVPAAVLSPDTIFPCKICKKVFYKVKSRSAHMKTHRMQAGATKKSPFIYEYRNSSPHGDHGRIPSGTRHQD